MFVDNNESAMEDCIVIIHGCRRRRTRPDGTITIIIDKVGGTIESRASSSTSASNI